LDVKEDEKEVYKMEKGTIYEIAKTD